MKKYLFLFLICSVVLLCVGCGNEEKTSTINCTYTTTEEDINLIVDMIFVRDNKKKIITDGKVIMTYSIAGLELLEEEQRNTYFDDMFSNMCDDLSYLYSDCNIKLLSNGAEIMNTFDLEQLESSSNGNFKRSHTIEEIKEYILEQNSFEGMTCETK